MFKASSNHSLLSEMTRPDTESQNGTVDQICLQYYLRPDSGAQSPAPSPDPPTAVPPNFVFKPSSWAPAFFLPFGNSLLPFHLLTEIYPHWFFCWYPSHHPITQRLNQYVTKWGLTPCRFIQKLIQGCPPSVFRLDARPRAPCAE